MSFKPNKKQTKKVTKNNSGDAGSDTVSDAVGNYEKHPFFVKKAALAKTYLPKVGLPNWSPTGPRLQQGFYGIRIYNACIFCYLQIPRFDNF
jgi:hypothetical protein